MRDIKVSSIPDCDICGEKGTGVIDAPVAGMGTTWANMCEKCAKKSLEFTGVYAIASKKILQIPAVPATDGEILQVKELTSMEGLSMDEDREVECPECGESKTVEIDADYTFNCSGCGKKLKCEARI